MSIKQKLKDSDPLGQKNLNHLILSVKSSSSFINYSFTFSFASSFWHFNY